MSNEGENWAPAVWDPTANGGAGGWVRRQDTRTHRIRPPERPDRDPEPAQPQQPAPGAQPPAAPPSQTPPSPAHAPAPEQQYRLGQQYGRQPAPGPLTEPDRPSAPPTTSLHKQPPDAAGPDSPTQAAQAPPAWPPVGPRAEGYAPPPFFAPQSGTQPGVRPEAEPETRLLPPIPPEQPGRNAPPYPGAQPGLPPLLPQAPDHLPPPPAFPPLPPDQTAQPAQPGGPGLPPAHPAQNDPAQQPEPYPTFFLPEQPGQEDFDPPRGGGRRVWIAVLVAAVLVGALVFGAVRVLGSGGGDKDHGRAAHSSRPTDRASHHATGGGNTPSPSPSPSESASSAQSQAKAMDDLLKESAVDRKKVSGAVHAVDGCSSPDAVTRAENDLNDAADHRDSLVDRLNVLELDQVEGGAEAAADLRTAWQDSADADRAFAAWAATMASGGCTPGSTEHDADYDRGIDSSQKAQKAKQDFVGKWNPIADEQGLEERSANEL
jgi:hypothetical protein